MDLLEFIIGIITGFGILGIIAGFINTVWLILFIIMPVIYIIAWIWLNWGEL